MDEELYKITTGKKAKLFIDRILFFYGVYRFALVTPHPPPKVVPLPPLGKAFFASFPSSVNLY